VKASSLTQEEVDYLKQDSLLSIDRCLVLVIRSRDSIMKTHKWSIDRRLDDRMLDLYSALCISHKDMLKYKNRFMNTVVFNNLIKNKDHFTSAYLVSASIVHRMLKESKQ
jgi:hypothetical protein